jgi:hypothetical protein
MKAAYPFIDDFLPAGTIASLERLGEILAGARTSENRLSGEAAASVTSTTSLRTIALPDSIETAAGDRTVARPLRN